MTSITEMPLFSLFDQEMNRTINWEADTDLCENDNENLYTKFDYFSGDDVILQSQSNFLNFFE